VLECSVCGKSEKQVNKIVGGPRVYLCDECIARANEMLDKVKDKLPSRPMDSSALAESLKSFIDDVGRDSDVQFHPDIHEVDLSTPVALLMFHIAREAVMNAVKHADPTDVWIVLDETRQYVSLEVRDNGSGFDTTAPVPEGHFGIAMMRERAKIASGTLEIASTRHGGTVITVRFPHAFLEPPEVG
jgi:two-component system nitrate/nitrite sensor histidine kinase NarX